MRISVHQPYWAPHAPHFKLFSDVEIHCVFDDVQHIRRGFVHRNKILDRTGKPAWLTLPLAYAPQEAKINELRFADDARERLADEMRRFPAFDTGRLPLGVFQAVTAIQNGGLFVPYAVMLLKVCCSHLGLKRAKFVYASEFKIPPEVRGRERILEICRLLGATHYLNSPGGRELYDAAMFANAGVELEFLDAAPGDVHYSVLQTLSERNA